MEHALTTHNNIYAFLIIPEEGYYFFIKNDYKQQINMHKQKVLQNSTL